MRGRGTDFWVSAKGGVEIPQESTRSLKFQGPGCVYGFRICLRFCHHSGSYRYSMILARAGADSIRTRLVFIKGGFFWRRMSKIDNQSVLFGVSRNGRCTLDTETHSRAVRGMHANSEIARYKRNQKRLNPVVDRPIFRSWQGILTVD